VVSVSTNVDEIFLLAAFFADPRIRARAVVAGQFLGMGALVAASAAAAWASLAVPAGYPALLGVVPLALGLRGLWALRRGGDDDDEREPGGGHRRQLARSARGPVSHHRGTVERVFVDRPSRRPVEKDGVVHGCSTGRSAEILWPSTRSPHAIGISL